jgi:hypothetical protein
MAPTIEQLEATSDAEVRAEYNSIAANTAVGLPWYADELQRRATNRQTQALVSVT